MSGPGPVDAYSSESGARESDDQVLRDVARAWRRSAVKSWAITVGVIYVFLVLASLVGGIGVSALHWLMVLGVLAVGSIAPLVLLSTVSLIIESVAKLMVGGPASFGITGRAQVVTEATVAEVDAALKPALRGLGLATVGPELTTLRVQPLRPKRISPGRWYLYVDTRPSADQPGNTVVTMLGTPARTGDIALFGAPQQIIKELLPLVPMTSRERPAIEPADDLQQPITWTTLPQPQDSYVQPPPAEDQP